jgi:hypothetical protein
MERGVSRIDGERGEEDTMERGARKIRYRGGEDLR